MLIMLSLLSSVPIHGLWKPVMSESKSGFGYEYGFKAFLAGFGLGFRPLKKDGFGFVWIRIQGVWIRIRIRIRNVRICIWLCTNSLASASALASASLPRLRLRLRLLTLKESRLWLRLRLLKLRRLRLRLRLLDHPASAHVWLLSVCGICDITPQVRSVRRSFGQKY